MTASREQVPTSIVLPCERTDAVVVLDLVVEADPVRVVCPGLDEVKAALAVGSADLVRSYCGVWTRWLARCGARPAEQVAG